LSFPSRVSPLNHSRSVKSVGSGGVAKRLELTRERGITHVLKKRLNLIIFLSFTCALTYSENSIKAVTLRIQP